MASGVIDVVGLGRAMVLDPCLAKTWLINGGRNLDFPRFESAPPGGITAWYTMRLTALAEDRENTFPIDLISAIHDYEDRDAMRCEIWKQKFGHFSSP